MKQYESTAQFYKSQDWANCKAQGNAIVFHHKKYLTNQNVNDASISINPNNIMVVHWQCHNEIHNNPYLNIQLMEQKAKDYNINPKKYFKTL